MPLAPAVKAVIILSSVFAAAGIAIYENPQFRAWLETRAREIKQFLDDVVIALDPDQRRIRAEEIIHLRRRASGETQQRAPPAAASSGTDRAAQVQAANRRRLYELAEKTAEKSVNGEEAKQEEAASFDHVQERSMEQTARDLSGLKFDTPGAVDSPTPLHQQHQNDSAIAIDAPIHSPADVDTLSAADTESIGGSISVINTPATSRPMTPSGYSELQDPLDDLDGFSDPGTETASHVSAQDASDGEGDAEDNDVISVASGVSSASGKWSLVGGQS